MTINHDHLLQVCEAARPVLELMNGGPFDNKAIAEIPWTHPPDAYRATFNPATVKSLLDELSQLRAQVEALKVDSMYYQYVRESGGEFVHYIGGGSHGLYEGIDLDQRVSAAITAQEDAAIAKEQP